jgi:hypothetical protein
MKPRERTQRRMVFLSYRYFKGNPVEYQYSHKNFHQYQSMRKKRCRNLGRRGQLKKNFFLVYLYGAL